MPTQIITTRRGGPIEVDKEKVKARYRKGKKRGRKLGSKIIGGKVVHKEDIPEAIAQKNFVDTEGGVDKILATLFENGLTIKNVNARLSRAISLRYLSEVQARNKIKLLLLLGLDNEEVLTKILTTKR